MPQVIGQIGLFNIGNIENNFNLNINQKNIIRKDNDDNGWDKIYFANKKNENQWEPCFVFRKYDDIKLGHRLSIFTDGNFEIQNMILEFGEKPWMRARKSIEIDFSEHTHRARLNLLVYPMKSFLVTNSMKVTNGKVGKISKVGIGGFLSAHHPIFIDEISKAIHSGEGIRIIAENGDPSLADKDFKIILDCYFDLAGFHNLAKSPTTQEKS